MKNTNSSSRQVFVLDTSVLIYDPNSLNTFKESDVVLPIAVLDELDKLKKQSGEVGRNARLSIRKLDEISNSGDIIKGAELDDGITFYVDASLNEVIGLDKNYGDNQILGCLNNLHKKNSNTILVTRDINLRVRAKALGIPSQDYTNDKSTFDELYSGHRVIQNEEAGRALAESDFGYINCADYDFDDVMTNEFILFTDSEGQSICPGRRYGKVINRVEDPSPWGLNLRNKEQLYLADLIMDTSIPLVTVTGKAGGGKSLVTIGCALELVLNAKKYDQVIIYRPIEPMGNDIGYLPGTAEEKLEPWFSAIDDAFAFLLSDGKSRKKDAWKEKMYQFIDNGTIKKEALTYIRGRSIPNALIIIDEFQNLNPEEAKTILTRAGVGSKVILTGDIEQIDNNRLDAMSNGLTYVIDRFKGSRLAGHITLTKGERSELATLAAEIL